MYQRAIETGQVRDLPLEVALSHFGGVMLNVPRLINDGALSGPALSYLEETANAVWRIFTP